MLRRVVIGLTLACLVMTAVGSLPAGTATVQSPSADVGDQPPIQTTPDGFSNTAFEIRLYENSSARWTVRHSTPLNETEREQFEDYAQRFTNQSSDIYADFQVRADRLTAFGTNATGREMTAVAFRRDARVEELGPRGVIELSFLWTNFSREQATGVVAGDVFQGGMYINSNQRLVVSHADSLRFTAADPTPDSLEVEGNLTASDTLTYFGGTDGRQFADSRPRIVLSDASQSGGGGGGAPSATSTATATATDSPGSASTGGFGPLAFVLALLLLVGLGGSIAWYSGALPEIIGGTGGESTPADADTSTSQSPPEPAVPDEELLSDEDRVLKLLEENGGRMKQVNIVNETDWSKSKVSMLLSDMEDEGDISKLRVGRENIISLSGEEPDAVGSPFDDE